MDCGVDNEDKVLNDDIGDMCSTTNSKVDTGCAENSVVVDGSATDDELDQNTANFNDKKCSKSDGNSNEVNETNSQNKMNTSFNVRNGQNGEDILK